jgi:hypothetical protein
VVAVSIKSSVAIFVVFGSFEDFESTAGAKCDFSAGESLISALVPPAGFSAPLLLISKE